MMNKYKKYTLIILLIGLLTTPVFAQQYDIPYNGFRLGLTAHPTVGWVKPQIGKSDGVALGFSYGLLADFNFAQNYAFATGLTVTTINGKTKEAAMVSTNPPAQTELGIKYKLQYIEIPLTVKLKTGKIDDLRWYGQFGLSNNFNIREKQDISTTVTGRDFTSDIKFYRSGLILGAGAEFDFQGNTSITTGLTFNNGFTSITSDREKRIRNHYIGINFGVFF